MKKDCKVATTRNAAPFPGVLRLSKFSTLPTDYEWPDNVKEAAKEVHRLLEITLNNRVAAKKITCRMERNKDFKKSAKRTWLKFTTGIREEYEIPTLGEQHDVIKKRMVEEDADEASSLALTAQAKLLSALEAPTRSNRTNASPYLLDPDRYECVSTRGDMIKEALRQETVNVGDDALFRTMAQALVKWLRTISQAAEQQEKNEIGEINKSHVELTAKLRARQSAQRLTTEAAARRVATGATAATGATGSTGEEGATSSATGGGATAAAAQQEQQGGAINQGGATETPEGRTREESSGIARLAMMVQSELDCGNASLVEFFQKQREELDRKNITFSRLEKELCERVKRDQGERKTVNEIKKYINTNAEIHKPFVANLKDTLEVYEGETNTTNFSRMIRTFENTKKEISEATAAGKRMEKETTATNVDDEANSETSQKSGKKNRTGSVQRSIEEDKQQKKEEAEQRRKEEAELRKKNEKKEKEHTKAIEKALGVRK